MTVIIPTRNEGFNIGEVIQQARPYADELLVRDGHSTDNTSKVTEQLGVKVILDNAKGKGDGVKTGIKHATGSPQPFLAYYSGGDEVIFTSVLTNLNEYLCCLISKLSTFLISQLSTMLFKQFMLNNNFTTGLNKQGIVSKTCPDSAFKVTRRDFIEITIIR